MKRRKSQEQGARRKQEVGENPTRESESGMTGTLRHEGKKFVSSGPRAADQSIFLVDMKTLTTTAAVVLLCGLSSAALAGRGNPSGTGQPSASCEVTMVTPGHAMNARGSAFNPNGVSGAVYANPTSRGGTASGNSHVVAQYDVACYHQTQRVAKQSGSR